MLVPGDVFTASGKVAVVGGDGKTMRPGSDAGRVRDAFVTHDLSAFSVEHDETAAIRRGEADEALAPVGGDGADVVGKADGGFLRQGKEGQVLALAEVPDERRQVVARAFVLAGESDAALLVEIDMAGGKPAQLFR